MDYKITADAGLTQVEAAATGLKIEVSEWQKDVDLNGLPFALGTLYQVKGGFVPSKVFVFKITGTDTPNLEALKQFIDFFFRNIHNTALYIKEIPQGSCLFAQESVRLFGKETVAA